jgi:hypothetical protein
MTKLEELKIAVDEAVEARCKAVDDGCAETWQWAWETWEMAYDEYLFELRRVNFRGLNNE